MSRRRRKKQRARGRRRRPHAAPKSKGTERSRKDEPIKTSGVKRGDKTEKAQYEFVAVEYRDADGNPTLPKKLIRSTHSHRYDQVSADAEIQGHVLAGYKPPLLMIERKLYEIHQLSVRGWRRSGQIAVEVEGWRGHEGEWFEAMKGAKLHISDPGLPGPHNDEDDYVISESSFDRKIVTQHDEQGGESEINLHHGTLDFKETWKSAWSRQRTEVLSMGFKLLLAPLFVAIGAGLALWWMDPPANPNGAVVDDLEPAMQHEDPATDGVPGDAPSGEAAHDQMPGAPSTEAETDTLFESGDSATDTAPAL